MADIAAYILSEEQSEINRLQSLYQKELGEYQTELYQNNTGRANLNTGNYTLPWAPNQIVGAAALLSWLQGSDVSLSTKKAESDAAKAAWENYVAQVNSNAASRKQKSDDEQAAIAQQNAAIKDAEDAKFRADNPDVYKAISEATIQSQTEQAKAAIETAAKKELEEKDQIFAQQNSRIIMFIGIGFLVIVLFAGAYFAFISKTKPVAE